MTIVITAHKIVFVGPAFNSRPKAQNFTKQVDNGQVRWTQDRPDEKPRARWWLATAQDHRHQHGWPAPLGLA